MAGRDYRDLEVLQKAVALMTRIYRASRRFPDDERFGLTSQLRRAACSVPANIAEGQGRIGVKGFIHHLGIARGSLLETETFLIIATNLELLASTDTDPLLDEIGVIKRMLNGLISSLEPRTPIPA